MSIKNYKTSVYVASAIIGALSTLSGCALEMEAPDQEGAESAEGADSAEGTESADEEAIGETEQAIRNGSTVTDFTGSVYLPDFGCSGALIAQDAILTAAHCVDHIPSGSFRQVRAEIMKGGLRRCITGTGASGSCGGTLEAKITWDPGYSGADDDTADDIAIITRYGGFYKVGAMETGVTWLKPYTGTLEAVKPLNVYGWGYNAYEGGGSGTLRFGQKELESGYTGYHFFNNVTNTEYYNMCRGDSGSPAVARSTSFPGRNDLLVGLYSNWAWTNNIFEDRSRLCSRGGDKERWQRVSGKMAFIEKALGRTCPTYYAKHANGNSYSYRSCVKPL